MEFIMDFINDYGKALFYAAITALAGWLGRQVGTFLKDKKISKIKKETVETCVKAVEQLYNDLSGPDKYDKAVEAIVEMLAEKGISCTDLEIKMLIESVVCSFNKNAFEHKEDKYLIENVG